MEKYKKVIVRRMFALSLLALLAVGLGVYDVFFMMDEMQVSEAFAFQCGVIIALGVLALVWIIRYRRILRSERELQIQYNKENDERIKAIRAKAGVPMIQVCSILMIIAGIIFSYFNAAVYHTLIAAATLQLIIACITKIIYRKIM